MRTYRDSRSRKPLRWFREALATGGRRRVRALRALGSRTASSSRFVSALWLGTRYRSRRTASRAWSPPYHGFIKSYLKRGRVPARPPHRARPLGGQGARYDSPHHPDRYPPTGPGPRRKGSPRTGAYGRSPDRAPRNFSEGGCLADTWAPPSCLRIGPAVGHATPRYVRIGPLWAVGSV